MDSDLKVIEEIQQRTTWTQCWWAVALVALGIGSSLALSKLSWWYTLAILIPTFILGFLLKDKIANPFVRPNPNKGPKNDRATWSRVLLPVAMIMSTTPTPDTWPWMITSGVIVSAATAWMLYENRNAAIKGPNA
ncbi:hypothetical protein HMPREF2978_03120 [Corynebacterium sp. HMSC074C01]|uniref:hypothetical protein n=1 Tax=Corynebacterium sp. HMSC074C01 TaxID=1739482 RepID=UPI0008A5452E|nr:hypothetical protein [Corynebacterium sp. HMSC074C01]OFP67432.1 hypothetical protein HMPREF2978_03120 [Corynebacterium sp. HMSC074C01]